MSQEIEKYKISKVFCPLSNGPCDRRCPAWSSWVVTTEGTSTECENGYCKKLESFDSEGRLVV